VLQTQQLKRSQCLITTTSRPLFNVAKDSEIWLHNLRIVVAPVETAVAPTAAFGVSEDPPFRFPLPNVSHGTTSTRSLLEVAAPDSKLWMTNVDLVGSSTPQFRALSVNGSAATMFEGVVSHPCPVRCSYYPFQPSMPCRPRQRTAAQPAGGALAVAFCLVACSGFLDGRSSVQMG
jgi:hypothetical protein